MPRSAFATPPFILSARTVATITAADGFKSPGVVVSYTTDPEIQSGRAFAKVGLQTASGVPLMCDEGPEFQTFRLGLFGLEKWHNTERTTGHLRKALDDIGA